MSIPVPILDSHIHLYPASELPTLAWATPGHPLYRQHAPADYRRAASSSLDLLSGFIFLETDRRTTSTDPDPTGSSGTEAREEGKEEKEEQASWKYPLQEISYLARIAGGRPRPGESHDAAADAALCRGIVPWAPVPGGAGVLRSYLAAARRVCERDGGEGVWRRVRGFRYLLQDKPGGTMLGDGFVEGVRFLGREGFVFDVGVDQHRRGRAQLEEVVGLVERAHEGVAEAERVVFVLNHLCKPDLTIINPETDPGFIAWRTAMFTLSKADNVYLKLSGALSEMPSALARSPPNAIFEAIHPWLAVVVATFGPGRIMFGSDWPVCTVGVDDHHHHNDDDNAGDSSTVKEGEEQGTGEINREGAWDKWRLVVERMCDMYGFDEDQTRMIFAGTARRAYGIE